MTHFCCKYQTIDPEDFCDYCLKAERIICAAVRFKGKVWMGHRHMYAMDAMHNELSYTMNRKEMNEQQCDRDQGFVTNFGRYVDRKEAMRIQLAAGIASVDKDGYRGDELYSEDLY